jgi:hypothetical protein
MRRVWLVRLFPVTVDDGIDVHVNAGYLPYFLPFSNFVLFFHFPISYVFFLMFIELKKQSHFKNFPRLTTNRLATHQFGKRWFRAVVFNLGYAKTS